MPNFLRKILSYFKSFFKKRTLSEYFFISIKVFLFFSIFMAAFGIYKDLYPTEEKKNLTDGIYTVKADDSLFSIRSESLDHIVKFIVVSPNDSYYRDIFIKYDNKPQVEVFKKVNRGSYATFSTSVLQNLIQDNKKIDFRIVESHKDINKLLGVSQEPQLSLVSGTESAASIFDSSLFHLFLNLLPIIGVFILFVYLKNKGVGATPITMVKPDKITDSLDDLVGLDDIKQELLQLEDMVIHKEKYARFNVNKTFNVMLTGAAGVGKTKIARCLAKRLNVPMYYSSASSLESGFVGGGSKTLKQLAKKASTHKRAIIFLDEAEGLLKSRLGDVKKWESDTINTLLSLLDGVNTTDSEIIWIVASNMDEYKIQMDDAMLRRFQLKVNFRLPNFEERKEILSRLVDKMDKDTIEDHVNLSKLASISSGLSPAILETMVTRASLIAIKENCKITQDILLKAFERVTIGLTDRKTTENQEAQRLVIGRHEVGHLIVKLHHSFEKVGADFEALKKDIDVIKVSTEAVSKMGALGFVLSKEKEVSLASVEDYEKSIMQLYGGMVNEEIYYGRTGTTSGAHNDIQKVSEILKVMVAEIGLYQNYKLNYSVLNGSKQITADQLEIIQEKSENLYNETHSLLLKYKVLSDTLVERLMDDYVLGIEDVLNIYCDYLKIGKASNDSVVSEKYA